MPDDEEMYIFEPKRRLKHVFIQLLHELLIGETTDDFSYTDDVKGTGLKVIGRYPNVLKELPAITVQINGLRYEPLQINRFMPTEQAGDVAGFIGETSDPGTMDGYRFACTISLEVTAETDDVRDKLASMLFRYFAWKHNDANINIPQWLSRYGIAIGFGTIPSDGDSETRLSTDDLVYVDGIQLVASGEVYSPKHLSEKVLGIKFVPEVVNP